MQHAGRPALLVLDCRGQADYPVAAANDVIASISCWTLLQPAGAIVTQ